MSCKNLIILTSVGQHIHWCLIDHTTWDKVLDFASLFSSNSSPEWHAHLLICQWKCLSRPVHYSLSITSFVNKKNKCDLTQKCPAGSNCLLGGGVDQLYLPCLFLVFVLHIYWESWELLQAVFTPTLLLASVWKGGWSRGMAWWQLEMETWAERRCHAC